MKILAKVEPIHSGTCRNRTELWNYIIPSSYTESAAAVVVSSGFTPASRSFKRVRVVVPRKRRTPRTRIPKCIVK
jgi:hypothetical protein